MGEVLDVRADFSQRSPTVGREGPLSATPGHSTTVPVCSGKDTALVLKCWYITALFPQWLYYNEWFYETIIVCWGWAVWLTCYDLSEYFDLPVQWLYKSWSLAKWYSVHIDVKETTTTTFRDVLVRSIQRAIKGHDKQQYIPLQQRTSKRTSWIGYVVL